MFQEANARLQEDDSHTVEVKFRLAIEPDDERDPSTTPAMYQLMEGKGMVMIDREEGTPTHTMWSIKPISAPERLPSPSINVEPEYQQQQQQQEPEEQAGDGDDKQQDLDEPTTPLPLVRPINLTPILCRICENFVAQWYFEKHNETCSETHRLEASTLR